MLLPQSPVFWVFLSHQFQFVETASLNNFYWLIYTVYMFFFLGLVQVQITIESL